MCVCLCLFFQTEVWTRCFQATYPSKVQEHSPTRKKRAVLLAKGEDIITGNGMVPSEWDNGRRKVAKLTTRFLSDPVELSSERCQDKRALNLLKPVSFNVLNMKKKIDGWRESERDREREGGWRGSRRDGEEEKDRDRQRDK